MWETLVGVGATAGVACVGFIIHLGSRVSVLESKMESFEKWLERVEEKLDNAIADKRRHG